MYFQNETRNQKNADDIKYLEQKQQNQNKEHTKDITNVRKEHKEDIVKLENKVKSEYPILIHHYCPVLNDNITF